MNTAQARFCFCKALGNQSLAFFHSLLIPFVESDVSFNFLSLKLGLKNISTPECEMSYEFFFNFRVLAVTLLWVLVCQYQWRSVRLFNPHKPELASVIRQQGMNTAQARFCFCKAVGNQSLAFFHNSMTFKAVGWGSGLSLGRGCRRRGCSISITYHHPAFSSAIIVVPFTSYLVS